MKLLLFVAELLLSIATNADSNTANNVISSHVLDTASGKPAVGVRIVAYTLNNAHQWTAIGSTVTDSNGRTAVVHPGYDLKEGHYLLHFYTGSYFSSLGMDTFYPYIEVVFEVRNSSQHYHVPITLSNYGYSTYKGQ